MLGLIFSGKDHLSTYVEYYKRLSICNAVELIRRVSLLVLELGLQFIMNYGCMSIDAASRLKKHFNRRHQRLLADSNYLIEVRLRRVGWQICYWFLGIQYNPSILSLIFAVFGEMGRC